jgi:hypothetical protein
MIETRFYDTGGVKWKVKIKYSAACSHPDH